VIKFKLSNLPIDNKYIETTKIFKKSIQTNRYLAELNGISNVIPNRVILINSLVLQEAKDSSGIENIITTHDELYRANIDVDISSPSAKAANLSKLNILPTFIHLLNLYKISFQKC
jgi:Fic family protein